MSIQYTALGFNSNPQPSNVSSVTKFGDLLDFGQLFKAFGNN